MTRPGRVTREVAGPVSTPTSTTEQHDRDSLRQALAAHHPVCRQGFCLRPPRLDVEHCGGIDDLAGGREQSTPWPGRDTAGMPP